MAEIFSMGILKIQTNIKTNDERKEMKSEVLDRFIAILFLRNSD